MISYENVYAIIGFAQKLRDDMHAQGLEDDFIKNIAYSIEGKCWWEGPNPQDAKWYSTAKRLHGLLDEFDKKEFCDVLKGDVIGFVDTQNLRWERFEDNGLLVRIKSVREAVELFEAKPSYSDRSLLALYIIHPRNDVKGRPDDFHKLIMAYCGTQDWSAAKMLAGYALHLYPANRDLLADLLHICACCGDFYVGEIALVRSDLIPRENWSGQLFQFASELLIRELEESMDNPDEAEKRALAMVNSYLEKQPRDEHAYAKKAELLQTLNKLDGPDGAIEFLESTIYEPSDKADFNYLLVPACCLQLIEIRLQRGEYDEVVRLADLATQHSAGENGFVSLARILYYKALALDGSVRQNAKKDNGHYNDADIKTVLQAYQIAYDICDSSENAKNIVQRYNALRNVSNFKDYLPRLTQRQLTVKESSENE